MTIHLDLTPPIAVIVLLAVWITSVEIRGWITTFRGPHNG